MNKDNLFQVWLVAALFVLVAWPLAIVSTDLPGKATEVALTVLALLLLLYVYGRVGEFTYQLAMVTLIGWVLLTVFVPVSPSFRVLCFGVLIALNAFLIGIRYEEVTKKLKAEPVFSDRLESRLSGNSDSPSK